LFTAQELHFGDFTLDRSRYVLQRGSRQIRLEKLPMELLILLVERGGELVSREEIAKSLWGKDVFVDVDHSINVAIRKIRLALRDDPERPRFVETVVGKGYRFAAAASGTENSNQQAQPSLPPAPIHQIPVPPPTPLPSRDTGILSPRGRLLGILVLVAAVSLAVMRNRPQVAKGVTQPPIKSLAVLPLKNLSGDPNQDYLADGMTEVLIGRLSAVHNLRVISRTSVMQFKNTQLSIPAIGKMLGVDAIVEGSVMREGNQIRIDATLIRAASDEHIWGDEYQREYRSALVLQDQVAQHIADRIEISLTPKERVSLTAAHPVDSSAIEDYLKGRYYFNQRTEDAMSRSIAYFQQAIAKEPDYALAYSGLADAYAILGFRDGAPSKVALSQAKAAALKALALDDTLAEPHASLAFIAETNEWDWATAEREYQRALELNPNEARVHHWYAGYLVYVGRVEQGISEALRARELDPLSLPINNALAGRFLVARRYDEALHQVQKTLELNPNFSAAHQTLGWIYLNEGEHEPAIHEFKSAVALSGGKDNDFIVDLGFAYATAGRRTEARKILNQLKKKREQGLATSASVAILYGALGESDQAFAWLGKAYQERDPELTYIKVPGRRFAPLNHDPRFQEVVRRVGLPE
jgi:TolB-like protein/DNA-binding winged helix-turn-helix (wHTH) protein/Flp pilus assembly protein TadD